MRGVLANAFQALSRHAAWVLAAGVFAGLLLPDLASIMRPWLPPAVAGLLFLGLLRVEPSELAMRLSRAWTVALLCAWLLLLAPLLVWGAVAVLGVAPGLGAALILATACPPIVSGPAMALLLRLDAPLMLACVVSASLLAPFGIALMVRHFIEVDLQLDSLDLLVRLAVLIGGCVVAALVVRRIAGSARIAQCAGALDFASLVLLLVFAVAIMDGVETLLVRNPLHVAWFVLAAFCANVLLQLAGSVAAAAMGRRAALTVGFASGNRNMGVLLAVLPADSVADVLLFFALAQIPIYVLPVMLGPLYRHRLEAR